MRIFIALDIPAEIRARLSEYMARSREWAPDARWTHVEGLHVTLKFVGEASDELLQRMKSALATVKAAPLEVKFEGVGFFPNPNVARVFWAGVNGGGDLPRLASMIDQALETVGIERESKLYHPHLTLARSAKGPLSQLRRLLSDNPAHFGTMTAREFFLYRSQPQKGGSKYTKLERFGLE